MTNTKKKNSNKRKLLGAVGMLTVSAAMLVSSTFAWFSLNKKVSASTMNIKAKSYNPYLLINEVSSDEAANKYGETAEMMKSTTASKVLKLVNPKTVATTMAWQEGVAELPSNYAIKAGTSLTTVALTPFVGDSTATPAIDGDEHVLVSGDGKSDVNAYVLTYDLYFKTANDTNATNLRLAPQDATNKGVVLTVEDNAVSKMSSNQFEKSARILFVNAETGAYALYDARSDSVKYYAANAAYSKDNTTGSTTGALAATVTSANGSAHIKVYMYFDGEDEAAFTDNAKSFKDVKASFNFIVDDSADDVG